MIDKRLIGASFLAHLIAFIGVLRLSYDRDFVSIPFLVSPLHQESLPVVPQAFFFTPPDVSYRSGVSKSKPVLSKEKKRPLPKVRTHLPEKIEKKKVEKKKPTPPHKAAPLKKVAPPPKPTPVKKTPPLEKSAPEKKSVPAQKVLEKPVPPAAPVVPKSEEKKPAMQQRPAIQQQVEKRAVEQKMIGQRERFHLYQSAVTREITRLWRPPLGIAPGTECKVMFQLDGEGRVKEFSFVQRSKIPLYDLSITRVAQSFFFDMLLAHKRFVVTFRQGKKKRSI